MGLEMFEASHEQGPGLICRAFVRVGSGYRPRLRRIRRSKNSLAAGFERLNILTSVICTADRMNATITAAAKLSPRPPGHALRSVILRQYPTRCFARCVQLSHTPLGR